MSFSQEKLEKANAALNRVREKWLSFSGVTAVDLGFKWTAGQMTQELAIRVHVNEKRPLSEIPENELIPKEIDGIPVDVIEATYGIQNEQPETVQLEAAAGDRGSRFEEIPAGVSIGSPNVTAGTLGAKVYDAVSEEPLILSNWHILAGLPTAAAGLPIWQPGALDGGRNSSNTFAVLDRFILGPHDAAVARLSGDREVLQETYEGLTIEAGAAPQLGMTVHKSGRTTGYTEGFIDGIQMTISLNYGSAGTRLLQNVFRIIPLAGQEHVEISAGGDSGSVWIEKSSSEAVGLHFAGEIGAAPEHALAHDMTAVMQSLNIKFLSQLTPDDPPAPTPPSPDPTPLPPPPTPTPDPTPSDPPDEPQLSFWQRILQFFARLFGF